MIEQFLNYMRYERYKSPLTVQGYGEDLKAFEAYLKSLDCHNTLESADSDLIRGWMEQMMDKGNKASSVSRRLSALRTFYRFALSRGLVRRDPARAVLPPKKEKPLPQFLKEKEADQLLDGPTARSDAFKDVRIHTILMVFYETGIRLSELTGLDDSDVSLSARQLKVTGKRNKQRVIPFGDELASTLARYMDIRNRSVVRYDKALFVTPKGQRMNANQVRNEVKKQISLVSSLKKRTPHVLRHTFATAMLNHGAGIESIKKLLGHASVSTTEVYSHTTFEQLKRVYKQAHPRA